jgi:inositol transport system substrate-binding protein
MMKSFLGRSLAWGLVSTAVLLLGVAGCQRNAASPHQIVIGVSYQNLQNEYIINLQHAIRAEAKKLHVKLVELDARGHSSSQISDVEDFAAEGVNAIILNAVDEQGSAPAVDIAIKDHIPIVEVNTLVANLNKVDAYVGSPDIKAGRMEAKEIMKVLHGRGNIVILQGPYGSSAEVQRTQGIKQELAKFPQAHIIAEHTANWERSQGLSVMENFLAAGRPINAVIAENDEMALGACEAIAAAHKQKQIAVMGIDAIPDALKAVENGTMVATIYQDAHGQGSQAVKLAVQLAQGHKVKHLLYIPFQLVTKKNVARFMKPH